MATDTHDALVQTAHIPAGPELFGLDAEGWVYVALTIFLVVAIFVAKAHRKVATVLDQRIADARKELDEAKALRDEAEALLADAKRRQADSHRDATAIIEHAKVEAGQIVEKARADTDTLIGRRGRMAEEKIAAAERSAVADVRAQAAAAAARAAGLLLAERHDAAADAALIDRTIAGIA